MNKMKNELIKKGMFKKNQNWVEKTEMRFNDLEKEAMLNANTVKSKSENM